MGIFGTVMRVFSYLFHLLLALFMFGLFFVAWTSGGSNLSIDVLPWQNATLGYVLLGASIAGIVSVALAVKRILPVLLFLWSVVVLVMLVRGYLFSSYRFDYGYSTPALLTLGAFLSVVGSWIQFRQKPEKVRPAAYESSVGL